MRATLRRCACGGSHAGGECDDCRKRRLRRSADASSHGRRTAPAAVRAVLSQPGRPLPCPVRSWMGARFGYDFHRVRIHDDSAAADSAAAVHAHAYAVGPHLAFGPGRFQPGTVEGRSLLAHELAHVVQQPWEEPGGEIEVLPADHPSEREAESAAERERWAAAGDSAARQSGDVVPRLAARGPAGPSLRRLVVDDDAHVPCRGTRAGAVATLQAAEAAAVRVLRLAAAHITTHVILHPLVSIAGDTPRLHDFRERLWRRFRMDYNHAWVRDTWLPLLARRYELVAGWIGSLRHRYPCGAPGVEPPGSCTTSPGAGIAWTASGDPVTDVCETFWDDSADEQAGTILHEWLHFGFDWLGDCGVSNRNNTVCYEMFARELVGTATAADYPACCAPPAGALPALAGAPAPAAGAGGP